LLVAHDSETHAALHRQLARGEADKRYTAWLDGPVVGDHGVIEQPLRVDPLDRPKHIVDPAQGKRAVTEWRVMERTPMGTRVSLVPRTERTHQLRVHAAHALGLGAPISGDRLYGSDGARLLLHAECLMFTHPHSGERLTFKSPAPF
jgi:tRNA pseudouridine32 synthase/23S rRNA pseudouridine746 synthase